MGKKIRITILVIVLIVLLLCFIPSPLNSAKCADGGTKIYSPIIPIYQVIDWNQFRAAPHSEERNPNSDKYDPNVPNGETIKGQTVYIFGFCVYDGRYTVQGIQPR